MKLQYVLVVGAMLFLLLPGYENKDPIALRDSYARFAREVNPVLARLRGTAGQVMSLRDPSSIIKAWAGRGSDSGERSVGRSASRAARNANRRPG